MTTYTVVVVCIAYIITSSSTFNSKLVDETNRAIVQNKNNSKLID